MSVVVIDPRPASVDVAPDVVSLGQVGATDEQIAKAIRKPRQPISKPKQKEATSG